MALKDLLMKPKHPAELRQDTAIKLLEVQNRLTHARAVYAATEADVLEGEADPSQAAKADAEVAKWKKEEQRLVATLEALDDRVRSHATKVKRSDIDTAWLKGIDLSEEREALIIQVEQTIQKLAGQVEGVLAKTNAMNAVLPQKPDMAGAQLSPGDILAKVRLELTRRGIDGDLKARMIFDQPSMVKRFEGIPDLIRRWREAHLAKL